MNKDLKAKIINNLKVQLPQMTDTELKISKDELAVHLWKKQRRDLGFHPIKRLQVRKGIVQTNNREILVLMFTLINNELERRSKIKC